MRVPKAPPPPAWWLEGYKRHQEAQRKEVVEALTHLRTLVDYAYKQGFHELGYDPVEVVSAAIQGYALPLSM